MGVPIALASERRNPNVGLFVCLFAAFGYYALTAVSEIAAQEAWLGAGLATWLPNLLFTALAIGLIAALRNRIPV